MPFQVSYTISSNLLDHVIPNAGDDQVVICSSINTISASIEGDMTGHSMIWEQMTGTPVSFLTDLDQLEVHYTVSDFSDRVFRLWIDKGTALEQYDEVTVFATPTDIAKVNPVHVDGGSTYVLNNDETSGSRSVELEIKIKFTDGPDIIKLANESTVDDAMLSWNVVNGVDDIDHFIVQRWEHDQWIDKLNLPSSARTNVPIEAGWYYRVNCLFDASHSRGGFTTGAYYIQSNVTGFQAANPTSIVTRADNDIELHQWSNELTNFITSLQTKSQLEEADSITLGSADYGIHLTTIKVDNFDVVVIALKKYESAETNAEQNVASLGSTDFGTILDTISVTDYTLIDLVIGGEQIGG